MSLFPAYALQKNSDEDEVPLLVGKIHPQDLCIETSALHEIDDIRSPDDVTPVSADEAILLQTSSESQSDEDGAGRKRKLDAHSEEPVSKKKKRSKRKKKREKTRKEETVVETDFYVDKKPDPGNLYVSTLYYPARPEYHQCNNGISIYVDDRKRSKKRWKRYYEVDVHFVKEKNYATEQKERTDRSLGDFENISDSKVRWDDSRTEKQLTEKTSLYNKYLNDSPQDVDKWLEFVKFQEDRYSYDVLNYRTTSESSARDVCRRKQLSILDVAISHNPSSAELLDAKLYLARLVMPLPEYLDMLKQLIASGSSSVLRLWCALTEGVFGSAALCSAVSMRDTHTAAAAALRSDQRAYVELFYRYGLFLRHGGLLEQLHLLMDLVTTMNFSPKSDAFKFNERDLADGERILADEETKLTQSGLPLSVVWARVERLRCDLHWYAETAGGERAVDPQRWPDAADVADMIAPVTKPMQLFTLAVHMLRLARVPILSGDGCSGALFRSLHPLTCGTISWEADTSESLLPLLLEMSRPSLYCSLVARHAARPNYFQHTEYLSFVERLFGACLEWTSGRERLALLIWWIRFHSALLTLNSDNRAEAARVRKLIQRTLKRYAESPVAFAEFARVERAVCGSERARQVALAALWSADSASRSERLYIARCVCETSGSSGVDEAARGWALACAALGRTLPLDLTVPPPVDLLKSAFDECEQRCADLWNQALEDSDEVTPVDCMLPSDDVEWWLCRYELLSRLKPTVDWLAEHNDLERKWAEGRTSRTLRMHEAASVSLVTHAGKSKTTVARRSLQRHPECVRIAAAAGARSAMPILPPPPPPSTVGSLASLLPLLLMCDESDGRDVCVGAGRRALAATRSATAPGAPGARCPLLWRLRLEAESRLDGGNAKTALYLALDACPAAKDLYVEGVCAAPGEFSELTDLLLEKQLRLHAIPEELDAT